MTDDNPHTEYVMRSVVQPRQLLVDERRAAELLGLQPRTLQSWRHKGEGPPYVRISARCVRYRVVDLETWSQERVKNSTSEY